MRRWRHSDRPSGPIDSTVLFVVVTLVLVGVTLVYATTCHKGVALLKSQGLRAALGLLALLLGAGVRYTVWNSKVKWMVLLGSVAVLALTLGIGLVSHAARRWMQVWFLRFQPSEFTKYALLVWLAGYLHWAKEKGREGHWWWGILLPMLAVLSVVALTLAQPALGTSFILVVASLALFLVAGARWWHVLLTAATGAALFVLAITYIPHARDRWERFRSGERHQQKQSVLGIGSGGPFGRGLGESLQKYQYVPKLHNDFIFAEIGEEFGYVGTVAVCLLYLILFLYGMRISNEAQTSFGQNLAAAISIVILLYAGVHITVALGLVPTTGQPLPFISAGGSALVSNLLAVGVLLNISRYKRERGAFSLPSLPRGRLLAVGRQRGPSRHKVVVLGSFGTRA